MTVNTTQQHIGDIVSNAYLLLDLRTSTWGASKTDKQASEEIAALKNAKQGSVKVVKNLMAGADQELTAIKQAVRGVRTGVEALCHWWADGQYIFPTTKYMEVVPKVENARKIWEDAVEAFVLVYGSRLAEVQLGALNDSNDYPSPAEVRKLFAMDISYLPVPVVADFSRVMLPQEVAVELATKLAEQTTAKTDSIRNDSMGELRKQLARMATQLGKLVEGENTRLFDTLVSSMRDCADSLDETNFLSDPEVTEIAQRIRDNVVPQYRSKEDWRDSLPLARSTLAEVESIAAAVQSLAPQPQAAVSSVPQPVVVMGQFEFEKQIDKMLHTNNVTTEAMTVVQQLPDSGENDDLVDLNDSW